MVPIRFRSAPFPSFSVNSSASAAKFWLSLIFYAALPALALQAETPAPAPKEEAADAGKKDSKTASTGATDDTAAMTAMMIQGQPVKGMKYAHRDENDKVVMEFETDVANKIDEENIEMQVLKILSYDDEGKQITIDMPLAIFNVTTRVLTGKDRTVIKRDDFEIIGETGEFNTKTRYAKFTGNVKMTILNSDNFDQ